MNSDVRVDYNDKFLTVFIFLFEFSDRVLHREYLL